MTDDKVIPGPWKGTPQQPAREPFTGGRWRLIMIEGSPAHGILEAFPAVMSRLDDGRSVVVGTTDPRELSIPPDERLANAHLFKAAKDLLVSAEATIAALAALDDAVFTPGKPPESSAVVREVLDGYRLAAVHLGIAIERARGKRP